MNDILHIPDNKSIEIKDDRIKNLDKKIILFSILSLIVLMVSFRAVYLTANEIHFELSYQNYLNELQNNKEQLSLNLSFINITSEETEEIKPTKELKFPFWIQIVLSINVILIIENYLLVRKKIRRYFENDIKP